jgi:hypothetical protein
MVSYTLQLCHQGTRYGAGKVVGGSCSPRPGDFARRSSKAGASWHGHNNTSLLPRRALRVDDGCRRFLFSPSLRRISRISPSPLETPHSPHNSTLAFYGHLLVVPRWAAAVRVGCASHVSLHTADSDTLQQSDTSHLLHDPYQPNYGTSGGPHNVPPPDPEELRRQRETLERICAETSE